MDSLTADLTLAIELEETSDVVALPGGGFFVVSDVDTDAAFVSGDGCTTRIALPGLTTGASGLEAVAYDEATKTLYVHVEEEAELHAFRWSVGGATAVAISRRGLRLGKKRNKGVEGLAHLPAALSPTGQSGLVLANEAKPRSLVFLPDNEAEHLDIELDDVIGEICSDFSGLSLNALDGTLLLVSDESATVVEIMLTLRDERIFGDLERAYRLGDERGKPLERVEGVCVDESGSWWVLLENACQLRRVRAPG